MDDLVAFLKARLGEDEADALEAKDERDGIWCYVDTPGGNHKVIDDLGYSVNEHYDVDSQPWFTGRHIARHDPARVLREVEAKRQRLALYLDAREALASALKAAPALDDPAAAHSYVRERINVNQASGRFAAFEMLVRLDAAIWCDHPDYRPAWKV